MPPPVAIPDVFVEDDEVDAASRCCDDVNKGPPRAHTAAKPNASSTSRSAKSPDMRSSIASTMVNRKPTA